jgi:hypothetical protein
MTFEERKKKAEKAELLPCSSDGSKKLKPSDKWTAYEMVSIICGTGAAIC